MVYNWNNIKKGEENERKILSQLNKTYTNLQITRGGARYDFYNDDVVIELKTRTNCYNKYPTTMIGKIKIDYFLNNKSIENKKKFCFFGFTDGLYFIEITKESIKNFELNIGGRCDRGRPEWKNYYYIPINLLEKYNPIENTTQNPL